MSKRGFTLAEIMAAVTIITVIATIAVPNYTKTMERAYWNSAQDILTTIYNAEQVYKAQRSVYCSPMPQAGPPAAAATCSWSDIYMDDPNISMGALSAAVRFNFINVNSANNTMRIRASRRGGQFINRCMAMNQTGLMVFNAGTANCGAGNANWVIP